MAAPPGYAGSMDVWGQAFQDCASKIREEWGAGSFNLTPWNRWVWQVATMSKAIGWGAVRDLTNRQIRPWQAQLLRESMPLVWSFESGAVPQ